MDNCPKCAASWIDGKIPDDIVESYSGTHWRREIGIDGGYIGIYDGIVAIKCPDCAEVMPASDHPVHLELFKKYKAITDE